MVILESQINGSSRGWKGKTTYKLTNGQVWQQAEYYYEYSYSYRPRVIISETDGCPKMKIEGVNKAVRVKRLK